MSETLIVALIGVVTVILSGAVSAWISARSNKKKNDSDAAKAVSEAVSNLIQPLNNRIDQVEGELRWYKFGVGRLIAQLQRVGVKPDWLPEMDRKEMRNFG